MGAKGSQFFVVVVGGGGSHFQRMVIVASEAITVTQVSHRLSNVSPARGRKDVRMLTTHIMVTTRLVKPKGIKLATKPLARSNHPRTSEIYRH